MSCRLWSTWWLAAEVLLMACTVSSDGMEWISVDGVREFCETEVFHAECLPGEVIFMQDAHYGRMKFSRCVDKDYGYLGCSTQVLNIADRLCSGRRFCDIPVPNSMFRSTKPCPKDLKPYFEASYRCVKVVSEETQSCKLSGTIKVTSQRGYLAKVVTEETGKGSTQCPWTITALPGQRINFTFYDFAVQGDHYSDSNHIMGDGICHVTAVIREKTQTHGMTICGGERREQAVYTTESNEAVVRIIGARGSSVTNQEYFMIKFEAIGCEDPKPAPHTWVKRDNDIVNIGCENMDLSWKLVCKSGVWIGDVGNCSEPSGIGEVVLGTILMPFGKNYREVSLVVIISIALGIGIVILALGLICLKWRINKRAKARQTKATTAPPVPVQGNTYDEKSVRPSEAGSQDSFPPPPPEMDQDIFNGVENDYAYIHDMSLPPPPYIDLPAVERPSPPVERDRESTTSVQIPSTSASPSPRSVCKTFRYDGPIPKYPVSGPGVSPKLLAHECALAIRGDNKYQIQPPKRTTSRGLPLPAGGFTPTYFELEPDGSNPHTTHTCSPYHVKTLYTPKEPNPPTQYPQANGKRKSEHRDYNRVPHMFHDQNTL